MYKLNLLLCIILCATTYDFTSASPATQSDLDEINTMLSKLKATLNAINDIKVRIAANEVEITEIHDAKDTEMEQVYVNKQDGIEGMTKKCNDSVIENALGFSKKRESKLNDMIAKVFDSHGYWDEYKAINYHELSENRRISDERRAILLEMGSNNNFILDNVKELKATVQKYPLPKTMSDLDGLDSNIHFLSRQVQSQQFNEFEKARSDGYSGLKQTQTIKVGRRNYMSGDFSGEGVAGINDDLVNTDHSVAIKSFSASLNGIEFRTKCCGFKLKRVKHNTNELHAVKDVAFPKLPPVDVFVNGTAEDQIAEMREWFKAFQTQDKTHRNYISYFKTMLTYLEGSWMYDDNPAEDENLEKFQYMSETGFIDESLEYLPKTIIGFDETTKNSIYARFSYRLLARHQQLNFKTKYLIPIYNPAAQKRLRMNAKEYQNSYAARFDLHGTDFYGKPTTGPHHYTMLDRLMESVSGKNNLKSSSLPQPTFPFSSFIEDKCYSAQPNNEKELVKSYYHRAYKVRTNINEKFGFSDNVYVAETSQEKVAGPSINLNNQVYNVKNSYAIPVELMFLTPLQTWNPYKIAFENDCNDVTGDGTKTNPYNASCPDLNYKTPASFFTGKQNDECDKDSGTYMVRGDGTIGCFYPSGVHVVLPKIFGIDERIRQRYPIMPLVAEGSPAWKKIDALIDSMDLKFTFSVGVSVFFDHSHSHTVKIRKSEIEYLKLDPSSNLKKATIADSNSHHQHILTIKMTPSGDLYISDCNSGDNNSNGSVCFDEHVNTLIESSI